MRRLFVDLDGVLADFDSHYSACTGTPWKIAENLTKEEKDAKWAVVHSQETFFLDLPLMPGAMELWNFIRVYDPVILSAASRRVESCRAQKIAWCARHLGIGAESVIVVRHRSEKRDYCQPGDVLIDDRPEMIDEWNAAGGLGVLFQDAESAMVDVMFIMAA